MSTQQSLSTNDVVAMAVVIALITWIFVADASSSRRRKDAASASADPLDAATPAPKRSLHDYQTKRLAQQHEEIMKQHEEIMRRMDESAALRTQLASAEADVWQLKWERSRHEVQRHADGYRALTRLSYRKTGALMLVMDLARDWLQSECARLQQSVLHYRNELREADEEITALFIQGLAADEIRRGLRAERDKARDERDAALDTVARQRELIEQLELRPLVVTVVGPPVPMPQPKVAVQPRRRWSWTSARRQADDQSRTSTLKRAKSLLLAHANK